MVEDMFFSFACRACFFRKPSNTSPVSGFFRLSCLDPEGHDRLFGELRGQHGGSAGELTPNDRSWDVVGTTAGLTSQDALFLRPVPWGGAKERPI